jgi:hypothetical protein
MKTELAHIPSTEVLENSFHEYGQFDKNLRTNYKDEEIGKERLEKADYLRR